MLERVLPPSDCGANEVCGDCQSMLESHQVLGLTNVHSPPRSVYGPCAILMIFYYFDMMVHKFALLGCYFAQFHVFVGFW